MPTCTDTMDETRRTKKPECVVFLRLQRIEQSQRPVRLCLPFSLIYLFTHFIFSIASNHLQSQHSYRALSGLS